MKNIDSLCINTIMMLSADAVQKAESGHPGMPMGDATMAYVLWQNHLKHNPKNPRWQNRDRFVLSAGHGSMLLYSLLYLTGHNISLEDIKNFRQWESKTPGHPEYCLDCGIEMTTGPLGQGFATGIGMAIAERYLKGLFNKPGFPVIDYNVYGIVSDGDLMEGVSSEAASLAGHLKLGNIIYLYSDNKITIEGSTDLSFTEDVQKRFNAYGWHTVKVDGYDTKAIQKAISDAKKEKNRPSLIIARTRIGYLSPNKQDTADAHGAPLGMDEIVLIKHMLGLPERQFYVNGSALKHMRKAIASGKRLESEYNKLFKRYSKKYPELARMFNEFKDGKLPDDFQKRMPVFGPGDGKVATRSASGKFLNSVADAMPNLIGGSADLAPSNNTYLKNYGDMEAGSWGRNLRFGVREHAMGAALNGMALSGMLIPYGGTFLIFSDYLRPASRLSALMKTHVVYVMTHDSIGLGEDGPTHQPVEHLASYRAMPGMTVIRPADANETVEAWKIAVSYKNGPVMLVLTRQKLPVIDRSIYASAENLKYGAYAVADCKGKPDVLIISSGSEVHISLEACEMLKEHGIKARVVNMASFELFEEQSEKYKSKVLPADVQARVCVEAAASLGWHRYGGPKGRILSVDRFGASAPGKVVFDKLGFTAAGVAALARESIKASK